jgi:hypothetical protein
MELIDLVEDSVVALLSADATLGQYTPRKREDTGLIEGQDVLPPPDYSVTVTAESRGDFKAYPGVGIKLVGVEVELLCNLGPDDERATRATVLGQLAGAVDDLLPAASLDSPDARALLNSLSTGSLAVFLVNADSIEKYFHRDMSRTRIVTRELVCAQV